MNKRIKKIEKHLKNHKELYIGIGIGVGLASITWYIMRNHPVSCSYRILPTKLVNTGSAQVVSSSVSNSFNSVTNNYGDVKRLSYIVSNPLTDEWWRSQAEAAKALGVSDVNLSKHLNHGYPLIGHDGLELVREGVVSAA